MVLKSKTRLHLLCSRAVRETDPQELAGLLNEIEEILCETIAELSAMLKDVEEVFKARRNPRGYS